MFVNTDNQISNLKFMYCNKLNVHDILMMQIMSI